MTNSGTQHLAPVEASTFAERGIYLISETYEQKHLVVQGASHHIQGQIMSEGYANGPRRIDYWLESQGQEGRALILDKLVTTFSSRDLELKGSPLSQELVLDYAVRDNLQAQQVGFKGPWQSMCRLGNSAGRRRTSPFLAQILTSSPCASPSFI